jgi:hypothetical protein
VNLPTHLESRADPTGLSGKAIGKLVDYLINEATTTIKCTKNCLAMKKSLGDIKPLVDKAGAELSTNTDSEGNLRSLVAHCCNSFLDSMADVVDMNVKVGVKFESGNCQK